MRITPVHAESGRYATSLLFLGGLWTGPGVWRGFASYLAHRGWEGQLLDLRGLGGLAERERRVADHVATLPAAPILIGHDAGALVAAALAARVPVAAAVLLAPLPVRPPALRRYLAGWSGLRAAVTGAPVPPPAADAPALGLLELPEPLRGTVAAEREPEDARFLLDLARGRAPYARPHEVPTLVLVGDRDPVLPADEAATIVTAVGAEARTLAGAGRWLPCAAGWQQHVGVVHRWLVQRLGEPVLDFYAEAMADRDDGDG